MSIEDQIAAARAKIQRWGSRRKVALACQPRLDPSALAKCHLPGWNPTASTLRKIEALPDEPPAKNKQAA